MGFDFWAFKVRASSLSKPYHEISWEDEDLEYNLCKILPHNHFSHNGFSDNEWELFKHIDMELEGDPYMSNKDFKKSVDIFNQWYIKNNKDNFKLYKSNHLVREYTVDELDDLFIYINIWSILGYGVWISY